LVQDQNISHAHHVTSVHFAKLNELSMHQNISPVFNNKMAKNTHTHTLMLVSAQLGAKIK